MEQNDYIQFCPICNETRENSELLFCNESMQEFSKGYLYLFDIKENQNICPCCKKGKLIKSVLTCEEFELIGEISNYNRQFLEAMIHLKETNIIEYELKMSQFRNQMAQSKEINSQKSNVPKCPTCGSTDIEKISAGKKAKGNFFFGFLSSDVRNTMHCKNCGYKW